MSFRDAALLIIGHGSTVNPDSSAPTLAHAVAIREREIFAEVGCCFWKEEPSLRDALWLFDEPAITQVYAVPNFISEGYFTRTVIPRELELNGRLTKRLTGQVWKYCDPVGNHPAMTELLLARAREIAPDVPESETSLLIVGHGTDLNDNSAAAAKREAQKIRAFNRYAAVLNVYMEEPPLVTDWRGLTNTRNVVVVPFFVSDGLHSYQDIPDMLGIPKADPSTASPKNGAGVFRRGPYEMEELQRPGARSIHKNRLLFYANSIGTEPRFADIIVEQARAFDEELKPSPVL